MSNEQIALTEWKYYSGLVCDNLNIEKILTQTRIKEFLLKRLFAYWGLKRKRDGEFCIYTDCGDKAKFDTDRIRWQCFLLSIRPWLKNLRHDSERLRMLFDGVIRMKRSRRKLFSSVREVNDLLLQISQMPEFHHLSRNEIESLLDHSSYDEQVDNDDEKGDDDVGCSSKRKMPDEDLSDAEQLVKHEATDEDTQSLGFHSFTESDAERDSVSSILEQHSKRVKN